LRTTGADDASIQRSISDETVGLLTSLFFSTVFAVFGDTLHSLKNIPINIRRAITT